MGDRAGEPDGTFLFDGAGRPANDDCILEALYSGWACPAWAGTAAMYWCEIYWQQVE